MQKIIATGTPLFNFGQMVLLHGKKEIDMKPIMLTIALIIFSCSVCFAQSITIHTKDDSIYIHDIKSEKEITLPDGERIEVKDFIDIEENRETFQSREGNRIYKTQEGQFQLED